MSNRVVIIPTIFTNARTGTISYGYFAYDNYEQTYCTILESIPDDDMEFLGMVIEYADNIVSRLLDFVQEEERGISIGSTYYEYNEIKAILYQNRTI